MIADAFVGILGVVVFVFLGIKAAPPPDPFVEELQTQIDSDTKEGRLANESTINRVRARLVYPSDQLSFERCRWDLPPESAELVRRHLRLFDRARDFVERIQIEGHADQEGASNCRQLVPYRDNFQLSQNRARAVLNALLGLSPDDTSGLDDIVKGTDAVEEQLEFVRELAQQGQIQVAGFGHTRPLNKGDSSDPANRRVEILVYFKQQSANP